ncbi:membrane protease YdiL (CAAX protease family) [Clostridium punense]|uniref:Membrane protease YdiL (CAAX protease family) n=1 Tax=Clostridium punense TaxID=1054297 RepID=A0ABS4K3I7_9CLOT|nr:MULTISPECIES: CPBP family intramembrane glutamic endopeptidase [Clostridium]EQB87829.1 hypothetical protein M918_07225 [Clostridium sp. BL8]MBP2022323.1 membrane protease YdiL (CAAX protease family) [Clostridium punense]
MDNNMKKKELLFLVILSTTYFIYCFYFRDSELKPLSKFLAYTPSIWISIYVINICGREDTKKANRTIISDRKALLPFMIFYLTHIVYMVSSLHEDTSSTSISISDFFSSLILLVPILILIMVFGIAHFFINIKKFNFKVSKQDILIVIKCFIVVTIFKGAFGGKDLLRLISVYHKESTILVGNVIALLLNLVFGFIYPALVEEFLFRGLLISGLKGFHVNNEDANIIQAIAFGIIHLSYFTNQGFWGCMGISFHILTGYLLGKIYLKTSSITTCAIFHVVLNVL